MGAFISVAIPTFRRPEMLARAVRSVIDQDYQNWEIVISDDSKDDSEVWNAGLQFSALDGRIIIIKNSRGKGQAANSNNAMLESQSPWIKLLHDDDWLGPGALKRFAEVAGRYPEASFISCAANLVTNNGLHLYKRNKRCGDDTILVYTYQQFLIDLYLLNLTKEIEILPSTLLINRSSLTENSLMRERDQIAEAIDKPFFISLARNGEVVILREGLIFYDGSGHPAVGNSTSIEQVERETGVLKRMLFDLIENKEGLPLPDTMARAQRIARLRGRLGRQPWLATIKHAACAFDPRVTKVIADRLMGWGPYASRKRWLPWPELARRSASKTACRVS